MRQNPVAILGNEICFDLILRPTGSQLLSNEFAPLGTGLGRANIQRDIFAHRAVELLGDRVDLVICRASRLLSLGLNLISSQHQGKQSNQQEEERDAL